MSVHDGKVLLVMAFLTIGFVVVLGVILGRIARRARRPLLGRPVGEEQGDRSQLYLGGPDGDLPLSQRNVTLRVCRECRELVLLDATSCKYCGAAQPRVESVPKELPLRIPSRKDNVSKPISDAPTHSIPRNS